MATKNLVPRNSGEGGLGTSSKPWGSGYYDKLYITGAAGWTQITGGAGGGGGLTSPLTTKGDIWGYSTDNARIPVGSDGQILVADSTQALGVKWGNSGTAGGSSLWAAGTDGIYPNDSDRAIILGNRTSALDGAALTIDWSKGYTVPGIVVSGNCDHLLLQGVGGTGPKANWKKPDWNGLDEAHAEILLDDTWGFSLRNHDRGVPMTFRAGDNTTFLAINSVSGWAGQNPTYGVIGGNHSTKAMQADSRIGDGRVLIMRSTGMNPDGPNLVLENNYDENGTRGISYIKDEDDYASWMHGAQDSDGSFRICSKVSADVNLSEGEVFIISSGGNVTPGQNSLQNFGSSSKAWGTGYFSKAGGGNAGTIVLGNTKIESDAYGIQIYQAPGVGGGLGNISGSTGRLADLYVNGTRITGGGGGGGASLWSENGSDIYYNAGNVGIGDDSPSHSLVVKDTDVSSQVIGQFSGANTTANLLHLAGPDSEIYLHAGYGNTKGGGLYVPPGADSMTFNVGGDTVLSITGDTVAIGNTAADADIITREGPGLAIYQDSQHAGHSVLDLIGTGSLFGSDNVINFIAANNANQSKLSRWSIGQNSQTSSNGGTTLNFAYKTGNGEIDLETETQLVISSGGNVGIGTTTNSPARRLVVVDPVDGANGTIAHFSGNQSSASLIHLEGGDSQVYLTAGYGNTKGGGLYTPDETLTFQIGADTIMSITGDTVAIGNMDVGPDIIAQDRPGLAIYSDGPNGGTSQISMVSSGTFGGDNMINFVDNPAIGRNASRWALAQDNNTSAPFSNLVFAYKTGSTAVDLDTDVKFILGSGGQVVVGNNTGLMEPVGGTVTRSEFQVYGSQYELGYFSGDQNTNYITVADGNGDGIYLVAGYGNTKGGGLASFDDASLTFHVGSNLVATATGTSFLIGNGAAAANDSPMWEGAALAVFGDTDSDPASINLISTGTNKNNNLINFREGSILGGTDNTWTIGQNIGSSKSDLVLAYKAGGTDPELTGADAKLTVTDEGHLIPGTSGEQNLGSASNPWGTGYFSESTIFLGETALTVHDGALVVEATGGATANVSGATARFSDLYVNGTRITGGGGGGGGGSSPWTENGSDIYYNAGNVGIGDDSPSHSLVVKDTDVSSQVIGQFSGANTTANLLHLAGPDSEIYLHAGYGNTKGGGLYVPPGADSMTFNVGGDTVLSITGDTVAIGNTAADADIITREGPGLAIYQDSQHAGHSVLDLIGTGSLFGSDNVINFIAANNANQSKLSRWSIGQNSQTSSNGGTTLNFAYKTGNGEIDLETETQLVISSGGNVGIGTTTNSPSSRLVVQNTGTSSDHQMVAHFSGANSTATLLGVEGANNEVIYLHAGYGNTKGGGFWVPTEKSIVLQTQDGGAVATVTGDSFLIHNDGASSVNHIVADRPGLAIFGNTDGAKSSVELISTGFAKADNTLSFIEGSTLGGTNNRWTVGQDVGSSTSNLAIAYKEGNGAADLVTDSIATFTPDSLDLGTGDVGMVLSGRRMGIGVDDFTNTLLTNPALIVSGSSSTSVGAEFVAPDGVGDTLYAFRSKSTSVAGMERHYLCSGSSVLPADQEYVRVYSQASEADPNNGLRGSRTYMVRNGNASFNYSLRLNSSGIACGNTSVNQEHPYGLYVGGDGYVSNDLHCNGELTATTKTFLIDHPSQAGKILRHGCLEGPEHGVYVRGNLQNSSIIELPSYWVDLVDADTITCQLTPVGSAQNLYVNNISNNQISIGSDQAEVNCHYLVQAERKDVAQIIVEETK